MTGPRKLRFGELCVNWASSPESLPVFRISVTLSSYLPTMTRWLPS
jgi:hypothetical protein